MKILHILTSPRAEGTPRLVLDWLNTGLYEQEVLLLTPDGELLENFQQSGCRIHVNEAFTPRIVTAHKMVKLSYQICKERQPDVVIAWMTGFSQWVHIGSRMAGVKKLIVHAGNPPGQGIMSRYVFSYLSFWTGRLLGSKVIACSNYLKEQFTAIPLISKKQFFAVYNCFNPAKFERLDLTRDPHRVIMVATFERHKDHATLLKAWQLIENAGHPWQLWLAGQGSLFTEMQQLAESLNLKNVAFLGSRKDIPELLNQSKLFVFSTTLQEGFGTVLPEAMTAGCKIVASDVPACREVLQNGQYGRLVKPTDPQAMATAIVEEMEKETDMQSVENNKKYASQFTAETMMERYLKVVEC